MNLKKGLTALLAGALIALPATAQKPTPVLPTPALPADTAPPSNQATPPLDAADVGAWLDGYMPTTLKQGKIAGAQVVVVKDGKVLFKKGYGYSDVAAKAPMDVDRNLMRIGSTSKLFTWIAVMQQVELGKIDLNADVSRYLDFKLSKGPGRPITMNDLMAHRGGFEEGLKDILDTDPKRLKTTERYLKENWRPRLFPAGTVPAYSNYGAALAGYIVQRVSGEPFDAYVARHILTPLQMRSTTFVQPLPKDLAPLMSKGYGQSNAPPSPFELIAAAPAGSVSTTGSDMANFMIANLQNGRFGDGQIYTAATERLIRQPAVQPRHGFDAMAHGFFNGMRNGHLVVGHGGDTLVFHTDLNLLVDDNVGIFVSFNSRGENGAVYGARTRLFDLFMDRYFPAPLAKDPPAIASAAADAASLAGHYDSSRRVQSGFIGLFYLLQQDKVTANDDGTISVGSIEDKRFREVAPGLWREVGGTQQLNVSDVDGVRTILDSANPVSVMQAASLSRNAGLNIWIAGLALLVILMTVVLWPVAAWLRRTRGGVDVPRRLALTRRLTRLAALGDLLYLGGWAAILSPIVSNNLGVYNDGLDIWITVLQWAAIIPIAGAIIGIWNAVLTMRLGTGWGMKLRSVLVAAALIGVVWIAWMGSLISFGLNY